MPLASRNLLRTPLATYGMVLAHFGLAVALIGAASESAFSKERLAAMEVGDTTTVGPWSITLDAIAPVAGPNWTAMEARLAARVGDGEPQVLESQSRSFWSPEQQTSEVALATRWNGQLYAVIGQENEDGRWQVRLWWKPFVTLIWLGGVLIALGGSLALLGRVVADRKRTYIRQRIAERREVSAA